ncbi:MAG: DUF6492 family protein [Pseudomonadota bacterium]
MFKLVTDGRFYERLAKNARRLHNAGRMNWKKPGTERGHNMHLPSISIMTPSYFADLRRCELLCESIDLFVSGYDYHYIVVGDEDLELFQHLDDSKRKVVASSALLPKLLPVMKWRGRQYWWSPQVRIPIYGWHLQQLRKFALTRAQDSDRVIFTDSDCVFCSPIDLRDYAAQVTSPLFMTPGHVNDLRPDHVRWWRNAHKCLGYTEHELPGDDFIGPLVVWEKETVTSLMKRIEKVCGCAWWLALARQRQFSEYTIYGIAVVNEPELSIRHEFVTDNHCLTYWDGKHLDREGLSSFLMDLKPHHFAVTIQSHTGTPIDLIREIVLDRMKAA